MGKSLIITEKPSVAQDFAKVLHFNFQSSRKDGYLENDKYVITWCVGHLVQMSYPEAYDERYKTWRLEDLPFLPEEYKYEVIKDVKKQYNIVHSMLFREDIDRVYWAGDSGKEGQTIEENIRNYGGVREGMQELRVWIDSQTEDEIRRGLEEAKPMSEYKNLGKSGIMRTIEDYSMGINFSRVMSVKYGKLINDAAGNQKYKAIAVGRVMTCVLGMVVIREREIRNFRETPFYRIVGNFKKNDNELKFYGEWKSVEGTKYFESPVLYKENGFKKREDALKLIEYCQDKFPTVENIDIGKSKKRAPLLYNLAELQADCTKRFKISPDQTLQIVQALYEKKLTTYPRTDARVLTTAIAKEISKNISKLKKYEPTAKFVDCILAERKYANIAKTQYTDDSKVTDHYAIIPTGQITELNSLTGIQKQVYDMIVRRFLSIFYEPAEYENIKMTIDVGNEKFFTSTKVLTKKGFFEITGVPSGKKKDNDDNNEIDVKELSAFLKTLKKGDKLDSTLFEIKEGKTSPPKRYTTGSMILAMENAGQLIEDDELREQIKGTGIGTSATRANIIDKLIKISYLNCSKNQILTPSNFGEMIFELVNLTVPALLSPKMSASWEKGLEGIINGSVSFEVYRDKLEDFIRKETQKMIDQDIRTNVVEKISDFAGQNGKGAGARKKIGIKCPICGGEVVTTPFGIGCSKYKADKTGCNFSIGEIAGIVLKEEEFKELLTEGKTKTIRGFKSKSGKKFDACLSFYVDENGKEHVEFNFDDVKPEIIEDVKCPNCGGQIIKTSFGYGCSNYKKDDPNSCRFNIGEIAGKTLSVSQLKNLLTDKKTDIIRGFKSKSGKKFDAVLKLVEHSSDISGGTVDYAIEFDFDDIKPEEIKGAVCPNCGGQIIKTSFGYGCSNYKKDDPNSCRFNIGEIAGKIISTTNVKHLLSEGRTDTIRGFKSKNGKKFDARIVLNKDESTGKVVGLKFSFDDIEPPKLKGVSCPICGGDIFITPFGYGCSNYKKDDEESCKFFIGKIASVMLNPAQAKELINNKKTGIIEGFVARTGMKFDAPLRINKDGKVEFDFPEKPKPVETSVECPQCHKKLLKTQWRLECECGFKIWHTIASVALTDEQFVQLFTEGRTNDVISNFKSKTGSYFSSYLVYDKEKQEIVFDFNIPKDNSQEQDTSLFYEELEQNPIDISNSK
ncbi:type IA DNA topoisomerase [Lachnobacterium bovis]|uniref:DNA topoisomerase n=1 Tax=Lachnobacterium bovis TaxID=140626 RepID=A0A1H9PVM5_9FIRM|nr:type IA DNA topoisomerase [Lachnobacterium bovis]SER52326.1 DNA topoisomerase-3 [Lachnobacterium bovis]